MSLTNAKRDVKRTMCVNEFLLLSNNASELLDFPQVCVKFLLKSLCYNSKDIISTKKTFSVPIFREPVQNSKKTS